MKVPSSKEIFSKSVNVFLHINNKKGYYPKLYKELSTTPSYMSIVLNRLKNAELIRIERRGRNKIVEVTEKGKIIVDPLKKIVELIE